MSKKTLVSGIITTYKRNAEYVVRAANSILNQTYANVELIVVDDSPEDYAGREEVESAILSLAGNVKYIKHEKNMGACAARNTGIKYSHGEIIGFLDDDDEWKCEKVEKMLPCFGDEKIGLVYCGSTVIVDDDFLENKQIEFHSDDVFDSLIFRNYIGSTSFPLIRRKCLVEENGFDEELKAAQDFDMWLRIAKRYKVTYVEESLVNYYVHAGDQISKSHSNRIQGYTRLIEKNKAYLMIHKKAYNERLCVLSEELHDNHEYAMAFKTWLRAVCCSPVRFLRNTKTLAYFIFR